MPVDAAHPLEGDAAEKKLIHAIDQKKFIRAREQAEAILRVRKDSLIARYALARVFHEEEANLPRALFHLRRAEALLLKRYGDPPHHPLARRWHSKVLLAEEEILGEMDRRLEQLATIKRYQALYRPSRRHRQIWPLMKLHRFAEAEAIAKELTLSSRKEERIAGYNGLLSIEFERERPRRCFKVAMQAVKATGFQSCVLALNTAEAAFTVYRFDKVEWLAQKSLQAKIKDCPASAHAHLANLYLLRGDFQRAIAAVKAARQAGVERRHRQQFEAGINAWLMRLLYALGQFDKAYDLAHRVVRAPDRVGMTSYAADVMALTHAMDYSAAIAAQIERLRERQSVRAFTEKLRIWATIKKLEVKAWLARRKASKLLAQKDNLRGLVRPYLKPLPPWRTISLIRVAGAGIVEEGIALARSRERMKKETEPYFDVFRGEIAYRRRQDAKALTIAGRILAGLPNDEVLLRGRVMAWAAHAALRRGRAAEARRYFDAVLHRFPTALRLLGIRLPVTIRAGKGALARKVARRLAGSRRLQTQGRGLGVSLRVEQRGRRVGACLFSPKGRRYACSETDLGKLKDKTEEQRLLAALDDFHDTVFAPKIDLTQQDINSLDGSAVRGRADQVLKEILGQ